MSDSKNSQNFSKNAEFQYPLKGFMVKVESDRPGWEVWHEGMGGGRVRIHAKKTPKKA